MAKYISHAGYATYGATADDPLSSGPLETLFVLGEVFPPWNGRIVEKKSTATREMQTSFYCPVCPATVLRLGLDPVAKCAVCRWSSKTLDGVHTLADLMLRDAEPWPQVAAALQDAVEWWKGRGEVEQTAALRKRSDKIMPGKDSSLRGARGDGDMRELAKPKLDDVEHVVAVDKRMCIPEDVLVLAPNIRKRSQMPPRRRLGAPGVQLISPCSNRIIDAAVIENPKAGDNSAQFLPRVTSAVVDHDCTEVAADGQLVHLWLEVSNDTKNSVMIQVQNQGEQKLEQKSRIMVELKASGCRVRHGEKGRCEFVVPLLFRVKVDGMEGELRYYVFVWHYRSILSAEARWLLKTATKRRSNS